MKLDFNQIASSPHTIQSNRRMGPDITVSPFSYRKVSVHPSERHDCEESKSSQTLNDEVHDPQIFGDTPPLEMELMNDE